MAAAATTAAAAAPSTADPQQCDLPKGVIKRIVKEKLAGGAGDEGKDLQINKEALLAFGESAKVFISYVTATANDVAKEKKRSTVSADDVFTALEDLEFAELLEPLREAFEVYKASSKEKKEKAAATRKRKSEAAEGGADGAAAAAHAGASDAGDEPGADTAAVSDRSGGEAVAAAAAAGAGAGAGKRGNKQAAVSAADEDMQDAS